MVIFGAFFSAYFDSFMVHLFAGWTVPVDADMAMRRQWQLSVPGIGASGMISAFIAAYLVRFWRNRVYVVMNIGLIPVPKLIRMPAWIVVLGFEVFYNLYYGILYQGLWAAGNTGYFAHLGGFISGFLLAFYFGFHRHQKRDYFIQQAEDLAKAPISGSYAAAKTYGQALEQDPGNGKIFLEMARCSHAAGDDHKSLEYYRKAVPALIKSSEDEELIARAYGEALNRYNLIFVSENQLELVRLLLKYGDWQTAQEALETLCTALGETAANLNLYIRAKLILAYILDHHAGKQQKAQEIIGTMLGDFPRNPVLKYASERLEHASEQVKLFNFNPARPSYPFSLLQSGKVKADAAQKFAWHQVRPGLMWKFGVGLILLTPAALIVMIWVYNILGTALHGIFKFSIFA